MTFLFRLLFRPIILFILGSTIYLTVKRDRREEVRYYLEYKGQVFKEKLKEWSNPYHR